jgi:hypothetical protein
VEEGLQPTQSYAEQVGAGIATNFLNRSSPQPYPGIIYDPTHYRFVRIKGGSLQYAPGMDYDTTSMHSDEENRAFPLIEAMLSQEPGPLMSQQLPGPGAGANLLPIRD